MWRWCAHLLGVALILVALAALPSGAVVPSYVGGSATHGHVEDGRYFVNPGHSQPIVEVSESTWRTVYWVERCWPFSALLPGFAGMFLVFAAKGPDWKPPPEPPKELPPWMIRACGASALFIVGGTLLFWSAVRVPWATMLFAWALICVSIGSVTWLYSRSLREHAAAEPPAAPLAKDSFVREELS